MSTNPPIPAHGWDVFELIEDPRLLKCSHPSTPHWIPRGGFVGDKPPNEEQLANMRLQGSSKMCCVRSRIEPETAVYFEFTDAEEAVALPEQTELFERSA